MSAPSPRAHPIDLDPGSAARLVHAAGGFLTYAVHSLSVLASST
jgi:hypothetical protein